MTVHVTSAALSYGADEVLADVSAIIRPRDRIALVGRNGAGKTTLLRLLAGELAPDRGDISMPAGTRVALHDQRPPLAGTDTLGSYVGAGAAKAEELEAELRELETRMTEHPTEAVLRRYDAAQREFERAGGYAWRTRLEAVARGLGFSPADLDRPLRTFSGGELTRASLVRALAAEPDVLLLDEPTNHLDTDAIEWLEDHLAGLDAGVVFVSHDRWFLESVATGVLEIDRGRGRYEKGSYSTWRRIKAERVAAQAGAFERQQEELAHLQRFVDRFRYGTKARQAQSKLKAMARIERVERPTEQRSLRFDFPPPARSGRIVAEAERLIVEVAGRTLIADAGFAVERGQRVALIGPNGSGKTTLFNLVTGAMGADQGEVWLDGTRIDRMKPWERGHLGLARTFQTTRLFTSMTVLENLVAPLPDAKWSTMLKPSVAGHEADRARELLAFVGMEKFAGQPAGALSYGQQKLVELAQVLMLEPRLVLLDEPAGGVNPSLVGRIVEIVRDLNRQGVTFLVVEHNIPMVLELCDPVVVFSRGRAIAEGAPQTIREDPVVLDAYLGDEWRPPGVTGEAAAPDQPQGVR